MDTDQVVSNWMADWISRAKIEIEHINEDLADGFSPVVLDPGDFSASTYGDEIRIFIHGKGPLCKALKNSAPKVDARIQIWFCGDTVRGPSSSFHHYWSNYSGSMDWMGLG